MTIAALIIGLLVGWTVAHFRNPICAWEAVRDSLRTGALVAGHRMVEQERTEATVTVLRCERCDKYHVGWKRGTA